MSFFVQPTSPPQPKTEYTRFASIGLAAMFVILAVAQLYSYEDFPGVIAGFWLPGGRPFATLFAALLVIGEVLAIPYLLSMRLSPVMRVISMIAGWLVIATWLMATIAMNVSVNAIANSGVLGATIPVAPGWWLVGVFVTLGILTAWVSWGMWPLSRQTKKV